MIDLTSLFGVSSAEPPTLGGESAAGETAETFGQILAAHLGVPVVGSEDEFVTSFLAVNRSHISAAGELFDVEPEAEPVSVEASADD